MRSRMFEKNLAWVYMGLILIFILFDLMIADMYSPEQIPDEKPERTETPTPTPTSSASIIQTPIAARTINTSTPTPTPVSAINTATPTTRPEKFRAAARKHRTTKQRRSGVIRVINNASYPVYFRIGKSGRKTKDKVRVQPGKQKDVKVFYGTYIVEITELDGRRLNGFAIRISGKHPLEEVRYPIRAFSKQ